MAASASLHADRTDGRPHTANAQRRANPNSHRGRMIEGHLSYTRFSTTLTDVTEASEAEILRDWEVIQWLNRLRAPQRSGSENGSLAGASHIAAQARGAEETLRARLEQLRVGFRLPDVELVGAYLPASLPSDDNLS